MNIFVAVCIFQVQQTIARPPRADQNVKVAQKNRNLQNRRVRKNQLAHGSGKWRVETLSL